MLLVLMGTPESNIAVGEVALQISLADLLGVMKVDVFTKCFVVLHPAVGFGVALGDAVVVEGAATGDAFFAEAVEEGFEGVGIVELEL
jgi:hypothetical protein